MLTSLLFVTVSAAVASASTQNLSGLHAKRQGSTVDFGAGNTQCTCPSSTSNGALVEVNAYLPGGRNYFLDCQYGPTGAACTYNTAGAAVNPPSFCPANSLSSSSNTEYCFVTCPAEVGGSALDTTQSNVVIVAAGANLGTSYTSCRYANGAVCQYNPATGALGNTAAGGGCPATNSKTSGCCFQLGASSGTTTTTSPAPVVLPSTTVIPSTTKKVSTLPSSPAVVVPSTVQSTSIVMSTVTPSSSAPAVSSLPANSGSAALAAAGSLAFAALVGLQVLAL